MIKRLLLALAAALALYSAARTAVELINGYLIVKARANAIAALTGVPASVVVIFLSRLDDLGIDLSAYTDSDLANALLNGFKLKFAEVE